MDGILNIDKPAGLTSYRVVAAVKRLSGEKRVGHAGTLDPEATGVLPVCLGKATRVIEFLMNTTKTYRAAVRLGIETDTYDAAGTVTAKADASHITREQVEVSLQKFNGRIEQVPPMYSALKHGGRPLYQLAREGVSVERKARTVTIHRLDPVAWEPPRLTLDVECSKGTYIRSLAHDLGRELDCGAHLASLQRTRCGIFGIKDAVTPEQLEKAFADGSVTDLLSPIDSVLGDMPALTLDEAETAAIITGKALDRESDATEGRYRRAYGPDGRFVGILYRDKATGAWRPKKIFL